MANDNDDAGPAVMERKAMTREERAAAAEGIRRGFETATQKAMTLLEGAMRQAVVSFDGPDDCPAAGSDAWEAGIEAYRVLEGAAEKMKKPKR